MCLSGFWVREEVFSLYLSSFHPPFHLSQLQSPFLAFISLFLSFFRIYIVVDTSPLTTRTRAKKKIEKDFFFQRYLSMECGKDIFREFSKVKPECGTRKHLSSFFSRSFCWNLLKNCGPEHKLYFYWDEGISFSSSFSSGSIRFLPECV